MLSVFRLPESPLWVHGVGVYGARRSSADAESSRHGPPVTHAEASVSGSQPSGGDRGRRDRDHTRVTDSPWRRRTGARILSRMKETLHCPSCQHGEWVRGSIVVVPSADGPVRVRTSCTLWSGGLDLRELRLHGPLRRRDRAPAGASAGSRHGGGQATAPHDS